MFSRPLRQQVHQVPDHQWKESPSVWAASLLQMFQGPQDSDGSEKDPFCMICTRTSHHGALFKLRGKCHRPDNDKTSSNQKNATALATSTTTNNSTSVVTVNALLDGCGKASVLPTARYVWKQSMGHILCELCLIWVLKYPSWKVEP